MARFVTELKQSGNGREPYHQGLARGARAQKGPMALPNSVTKTVVLVDDNEQILTTTTAYLEARGISVISSRSALGVSALVMRHHPSVIVLDVMMPALDGQALAGLLRNKNGARGTHIIFYSAMEEEQLDRIVRETPFASYVPKADGLPALYSAIQARL